jgi:two-component system invasion response regulator UvrY
MDILIVDDHPVVRKGLKQILEAEFDPANIGEAEDSRQALELVRSQPWDVVILDISIPPRSGLDILGEIKAGRPKLPVLILSIHPEDQYAVRALRAGASGYLTKECAPKELVKAVGMILKGGKYISSSLAEKLADRLSPDARIPLHERLSDREFQVLCLIASGKTTSEIAAELFLSVKTIGTFRARILEKMGMKSNAELAHYAIKNGLIE